MRPGLEERWPHIEEHRAHVTSDNEPSEEVLALIAVSMDGEAGAARVLARELRKQIQARRQHAELIEFLMKELDPNPLPSGCQSEKDG